MSQSEFEQDLAYSRRYKLYTESYYRGVALYWILLAGVFILFTILPFLRVDVTMQSQGVIRSINQPSAIHSPIASQINFINIEENLLVSEGDTLIGFNSSGVNEALKSIDFQVNRYEHFVKDLDYLLLSGINLDSLNTFLYKKELDDFLIEIGQQARIVEKRKADFNRTFSLFKDGVLPETDLLEDSFLLEKARGDYNILLSGRMADWEKNRKDYKLLLDELLSRREQLLQERDKHYVVAPFDGFIIDYNGKTKGSFVNSEELMCRISPASELIAECFVAPSDIGLVKKGMEVRLQISALPYNEWGLGEAIVSEIGDDIVEVEGDWYYKVRCHLDSDYLVLSNGVKGHFKKGMSLTGRFIVTQRTLFQLMFDKVDDWLNPKNTGRRETL